MASRLEKELTALRRRLLRMAAHVEDIVRDSCATLFEVQPTLARDIIERDELVDQEEVSIEGEVIRLLALYQPIGHDLRLLTVMLKLTRDLERIADCAINVAERCRHSEVQALASTDTELQQMSPVVRRTLRGALHALAEEDTEEAQRVIEGDQAVDALYGQIVRRVVADAPESPDQIAAQLDIISVAKNLERIADHATNICEEVIFLSTGRIVRHGS